MCSFLKLLMTTERKFQLSIEPLIIWLIRKGAYKGYVDYNKGGGYHSYLAFCEMGSEKIATCFKMYLHKKGCKNVGWREILFG